MKRKSKLPSSASTEVFYQAWRTGTDEYLGDDRTLGGLAARLQKKGCSPCEVKIQGCVLRPPGQPQGFFSVPLYCYGEQARSEQSAVARCWRPHDSISDYVPAVPDILAV